MRAAIQNSRIDDRQQCDSQVVKAEGARPQMDIVSEIRRIATCALQFSEVLLKEWLPDGRLKAENIGQLTLREVKGPLGGFLSTQKPANGAISRVKMEGEISSVCWHTFKASNNQSLLK